MKTITVSLVWVLTAVLGTTQSVVGFQAPNQRAESERPNVVLILVDDLGYTDLTCYGSSFYETPKIDALASRSVRFTDFYSANPVCSPTRAALMTGKAPQRVGITQWIPQPSDVHLPLDEVTIGEAFEEAGYQTGYIGKWHLGEKTNQLPAAQGFGWMKCVNRAGQPGDYFFPFQRKSKNSAGVAYWDVPDLVQRQAGDYLTDGLTDQAISFISENKDRPFFLCFAHYAVHTPIQAPTPLIKKYERKLELNPQPGTKFVDERNGVKSRAQQDNPTYAAMVENLDTNVGRVLEHLEELSLTNNTIVIFTSDNGGLSTVPRGGPTSCLPLRAGKGWTYEGGIRIPTMVAWPKKITPGVSATLGITMDLYPTLLELASLKAKPEQHLDGLSLATALQGKATERLNNRFLAWTYPHQHGSGHTPSNAIRSGDWKLVHHIDKQTPNADRYELYNLATDLGEKNNLAVEHFEKTHELAKTLSQWIEKTTGED